MSRVQRKDEPTMGRSAEIPRVAVTLWTVTCGLTAVGLVLAVTGRPSTSAFVHSFGLGSVSAALGFSTVGALLVVRHPSHPVGRLMLAQGMLFGVSLVCNEYALISQPGGPLPGAGVAGWLGNWVWVPVYALLGLTFLYFPDGTLPSRRWRPLAWLLTVAAAVATVTHALLPTPFATGTTFDNPIAWTAPALADFDELALSVAILALLPAATSLLVRLRRARGQQRIQLRTFCVTSAVAIVVYVALGTFGLGWLAFTLAWPTVALAAGVAILRHRLFDIDVVVSRTLVVAVLAAFFTFVHLVVVVGVGAAVGARRDDPLLAIAATALAAIAFQPVRTWVTTAADRLVHGRRISPYEALAQFTRRLHEPLPAADLLADLVQLLGAGTGAARVRAWLRVGDQLRATATWPPDTGPAPPDVPLQAGTVEIGSDLIETVRDGDEVLGILAIDQRPGEPFTTRDAELAAGLAAQAGLVLRNARLTAELEDSLDALRASRQRLLTAHDKERRRLERDLHDGIQQDLLGLTAALAAARTLLAQAKVEEANDVLDTVQDHTQRAIGELRDLARGVYPPLLAERGLGAALHARLRSVPGNAHLEIVGVDRLPGEVEGSLYYCCLEALQNVTKHAAATSVEIRIDRSATAVRVRIRDDGIGFVPELATHGQGLANLRDRIDALGGTVTIRSSPAEGTTIEISVPLAPDPPAFPGPSTGPTRATWSPGTATPPVHDGGREAPG